MTSNLPARAQGFAPAILAIQDSYTPHVKAFADYLTRNGGALTMDALKGYLSDLNGSRYAAGSVRVKRQAAIRRTRQAFAHASLDDKARLEAALGELNRDGATKAPKVNSFAVGSEKVISPDEYQRMMEWTSSERLRCFLETLWLSGCRVSEILSIRPEDVKEQGMLADCRVLGKGAKERHIRLPLALVERIRETFGEGPYLFSTENGNRYSRCYVSGAIRRIADRALGRKLSAHCLRHSFATRIIGKTHKIAATSTYLGHSSPSITLGMYVHESLESGELFSDKELGLANRKPTAA